jgi:hypothetical protein
MLKAVQGEITLSSTEASQGQNDAVKAFATTDIPQHITDVKQLQVLLAQIK